MAGFASLREVLDHLPRTATVVEVSARDGLQARSEVLSPETRARWVRDLFEAGVPEAEVGSFVNPRLVPQMEGTEQVFARLATFRDRLWALVPNRRGLEDALTAGVRNVVCLVSATETHSRANLGRPIAGVLRDLGALVRSAEAAGARCRAAVSMAWVDPTEGEVPTARAAGLCQELWDLGFLELTLCDTYGAASPRAVAELLEAVQRFCPPDRLGLHLHDTFGVASANTLVGLAAGVSRFDASIGGLGGCPFAPGARGNVDTGHLVLLLEGLGVSTGIDPATLADATRRCLGALPGPA